MSLPGFGLRWCLQLRAARPGQSSLSPPDCFFEDLETQPAAFRHRAFCEGSAFTVLTRVSPSHIPVHNSGSKTGFCGSPVTTGCERLMRWPVTRHARDAVRPPIRHRHGIASAHAIFPSNQRFSPFAVSDPLKCEEARQVAVSPRPAVRASAVPDFTDEPSVVAALPQPGYRGLGLAHVSSAARIQQWSVPATNTRRRPPTKQPSLTEHMVDGGAHERY